MYKVMLQTVGTGRRVYEAITKSIYEANPTFVYFFCSDTSQDTLEDVLEQIEAEEILTSDKCEMVSIPDINDHNDVFQQVISVIEQEKEKELEDKQFVIDYTSGTKAMSVGLALAGASAVPGGSFRYVGSKYRDQEYGRVFSGEEDIKIRRSPTYYLGYQDERQIRFLYENHAYKSAADLIEDVLDRNPSLKMQRRLEKFKPVCLWLDAWDNFDYKRARELSEDLQPENLEAFGVDSSELDLKKQFLATLCRQSFIHDDQQEAVPSHEIICDLYQNTRRRLEQNHRMEAWVRLKRMHFVIIQFMLMTKFGVNPLRPDPETIRNHFSGEPPDDLPVKNEPLNHLTAHELLETLEGDSHPRLFELDFYPAGASPLLGSGFQPAPEQTDLESNLQKMLDAFQDYSTVLETEEDISSLITHARFPEFT